MSFLKKVADTFLSTEDDMDKEIRKKEREKARDKETEKAKEKEREKAREPGSNGKWDGIPIKDPLHPSERFELMRQAEEKNQKKILKKIKELFPNVDIEFLEEIYNKYQHYDGDNEEGLLEMYNLEKLNYSQFIAFRFACKNRGEDLHHPLNGIDINEIDPNIFMSNVNLKWKMLQIAKKDKTISIPPPKPPEQPTAPKRNSPKSSPKSPPKPPEKPTVPKRNSPKSPEQPTAPKRQSPKSSPKSPPKSPPKPPPLPSDPNYELEMAFRNLEKKSKSPPNQKMTSYKNRDLTNTELENLFRK